MCTISRLPLLHFYFCCFLQITFCHFRNCVWLPRWLTAYVSSCRGAGAAAGPPVLVWGWCHLIRRAAEVTSPLMTPQVLMTTEGSYHNTVTEGRMRKYYEKPCGSDRLLLTKLKSNNLFTLSVSSSQWMCVSIILHFLTGWNVSGIDEDFILKYCTQTQLKCVLTWLKLSTCKDPRSQAVLFWLFAPHAKATCNYDTSLNELNQMGKQFFWTVPNRFGAKAQNVFW